MQALQSKRLDCPRRFTVRLSKVLYGFVCLVALSGLRLFAQNDPCANPTAPRVGVFILSKEPAKSADGSYDLVKRQYDVEKRFQVALIKQLSKNCIVRDSAVFDDPKNFPALRGSAEITITGDRSLHNSKVAAIAVQLRAIQGIYAEQSFPLGFLALLIEDDSDYDLGAKTVLVYWGNISHGLAERGGFTK